MDPAAGWIWTPEPPHPALVDKAAWDKARGWAARRRSPRPRDTHPAHRPP